MKILEIQHIKKAFSGLELFQDLSLELEAGTITSILGENGSGKTTLFHLMTGMLAPDAGTIRFKDQALHGLKPKAIARLGIGRVWQTPRVFKNLSVLDNLLLAAPDHPGSQLRHYLRWNKVKAHEEALCARAADVAAQMHLSGNLGKTAGALSLGMQKLLSLGMLLMGQADLLLLDEPFAGVSLTMIEQMSSTLSALRASGRTICLIEHHREQAAALSDHCFLLTKGKLVAALSAKEVDDAKS